MAAHAALVLVLSLIDRPVPPAPKPPRSGVSLIELPPVGGATEGVRPSFGPVEAARLPAVRPSALPSPIDIPEPTAQPDTSAPAARQPGGPVRIGPGLAQGKLWVRPLPLPPQELAQRLARTHTELVDSAVTAVIQAFLDSAAMDPASRATALPSWTTTIGGTKFGLDSKYLYIAGLKIPAAILALLPMPPGNESKAFDRSGRMYDDLRYAAQRSATLDEFKDVIKDIRSRKEREREFERNQRTPPSDSETPNQ